MRWLLDEKTKKKKKKNTLMMRIEDGTPHVLKRVSTRVKVPTFLLLMANKCILIIRN
jgi:hypothetical protein